MTKPNTKQVTHNGTALDVVIDGLQTGSGSGSVTAGAIAAALGYIPVRPVSPVFTGTPTAPTAPTNNSSTQLATTAYVTNKLAGVQGGTLAGDLADDTDALKGASLVGYQGRTLRSALDDRRTLTSFGAVGDGNENSSAANDAAIALAIAYIGQTGKSVYVPQGTYVCSPFKISSTNLALQGAFYGDSAERTVFKMSVDSGGFGAIFVQFGDETGAALQVGLRVTGLTFDSRASVNTLAANVCLYHVHKSSFTDCRFLGSSKALLLRGGSDNVFTNCLMAYAINGIHLQEAYSLQDDGYPSNNTFYGGSITENNGHGVTMDAGTSLSLRNMRVSRNGSTPQYGHAGVLVGSGVGGAATAYSSIGQGLTAVNCIFEGNKGTADIWSDGGACVVDACTFLSPDTQYDMYMTRGAYRVSGCICILVKTYNLYEFQNPIIEPGSLITVSRIPNMLVDPSKTTVLSGYGGVSFSGLVSSNTPKAFIQTGKNIATTAFIYFPAPFSLGTTPVVTATVEGSFDGASASVRVNTITHEGFAASVSSGNQEVNALINWIAVGTKA